MSISPKTISYFMFVFVGASILSGIMEGAGGPVATRLTVATTEIATTLNVAGTSGFLSSSYVIIENEKVKYTNTTDTTVTGCIRGWDDTDAVAHSFGAMVYSPDMSVLNDALGFNIASTSTAVGAINIPIMLVNFALRTVPRIVTWDYSFLRGEGGVAYFRLFLGTFTVGFIIGFAFVFVQTLWGIFKK